MLQQYCTPPVRSRQTRARVVSPEAQSVQRRSRWRASPAYHSAARCDARARAPGAAFPLPSSSRHSRRGRVHVPAVASGGAREADCLAPDARTRRVPPDCLRGPRVGLQPERRRIGAGVLRDAPGRGAPQVLLRSRARRRRRGGHRRGRPRLLPAVRARALLDATHRARSVSARAGERRSLRDASRTRASSGRLRGLRVRCVRFVRRREPRTANSAGVPDGAGPSRRGSADGSVIRRAGWRCSG